MSENAPGVVDPTVIQALAIQDMTREVREVNTANGWHDHGRTFGDGIALIHSEVSEALEAYRAWGVEDATGPPMNPGGTNGAPPKPEGVGSEFADILIRLLDECDRQGIDLSAEFTRKLAHNRTRGYHHGGKTL
jgi:NTP pyrophosphatase (non-canonical NTP hydrolase)